MQRKGLGLSRLVTAMLVMALAGSSIVLAGDTAEDSIGATLTMGNDAPTVDAVVVGNSGTYNPTATTTTAIAVNVTASDANGWEDINTSDADTKCVVSYGGVTHDLTCVFDSNSSATTAVFECTGTMDYWNLKADWAVNCTMVDSADGSDFDDTELLTYTRLEYIDLDPSAISWTSITTSSTDVGADDDPVAIANGGNAYFAKVNVTADDLAGVTTPAEVIAATDFSVNVADAANGDGLSTAAVAVTGGTLTIGEAAEEDLYFFLEQISTPVSAQSYSAAEWTVTVWDAADVNA